MHKMKKPRLAIAAQILRQLAIRELALDEIKRVAGGGMSDDPPCSISLCTGMPH
jgi:hypothetical protein